MKQFYSLSEASSIATHDIMEKPRTTTKNLSVRQLDALAKCVKDRAGQPLTCYGCKNSIALFDDSPEDDTARFPGKPSGETNCLHCIRNLHREAWLREMGKDATGDLYRPFDLYCTLDAYRFKQFEKL